MNIELPDTMDDHARALLRTADEDAHPIADRTFTLTGSLGALYGSYFYAGDGVRRDMTLVLRVRDGTRYVSVIPKEEE